MMKIKKTSNQSYDFYDRNHLDCLGIDTTLRGPNAEIGFNMNEAVKLFPSYTFMLNEFYFRDQGTVTYFDYYFFIFYLCSNTHTNHQMHVS